MGSSAPSEPFTWKTTWPFDDRSCSACGKELRVQDVGEHRTLYENGKEASRFLWCKEHRGMFEWEPQEC